jgi:hypothetical protein
MREEHRRKRENGWSWKYICGEIGGMSPGNRALEPWVSIAVSRQGYAAGGHSIASRNDGTSQS